MGTLLLVLDLIGTFGFALSGATAGVKHRLDLFGVLVLSFAAGNVGGIARDLLIGAVPTGGGSRLALFGRLQPGSRHHKPTRDRPAARGASSWRHVAGTFVEDGLGSPRTTSEEAPMTVRAATCHDAPFVLRASLPVKSPKSLLRCGGSNRPGVPGVLWSSAHPFVPRLARAGRLIGSRARHRRARTGHGARQQRSFAPLKRWGSAHKGHFDTRQLAAARYTTRYTNSL